jgi:hypothetical protein
MTPEPLISPEAVLNAPDVPEVNEYDFETVAGRIYMLTGK